MSRSRAGFESSDAGQRISDGSEGALDGIESVPNVTQMVRKIDSSSVCILTNRLIPSI